MPANSLLFKPSVTQPYDLNIELLVRYSGHGLNNKPFGNQTILNHSNTELVRYSDPLNKSCFGCQWLFSMCSLFEKSLSVLIRGHFTRGSEVQTNSLFEWWSAVWYSGDLNTRLLRYLKVVWSPNGLVFDWLKWWSEYRTTGQVKVRTESCMGEQTSLEFDLTFGVNDWDLLD